MKPDKEIEKFIEGTVDSILMWELVVFVANNPGITDNADGIAGRLGRRRDDLSMLLDKLCEANVMKKWGDNRDPIYAYSPKPEVAHALQKFITFNNNKEGKLLIWSELLKHGLR